MAMEGILLQQHELGSNQLQGDYQERLKRPRLKLEQKLLFFEVLSSSKYAAG
jgi:hypothetical protein